MILGKYFFSQRTDPGQSRNDMDRYHFKANENIYPTSSHMMGLLKTVREMHKNYSFFFGPGFFKKLFENRKSSPSGSPQIIRQIIFQNFPNFYNSCYYLTWIPRYGPVLGPKLSSKQSGPPGPPPKKNTFSELFSKAILTINLHFFQGPSLHKRRFVKEFFQGLS